ncbi:hypothetical protein BGLA2_990088 [Burkholderia gladioli]|nr:hypothetical protein BGLA2_990088 [Burkholderia gladioli]
MGATARQPARRALKQSAVAPERYTYRFSDVAAPSGRAVS